MAKFNINDILKGVMYGILLHVVINVLLPKLKTIDFSTMFNVQAQPQAPAAPAAPTPITPATPEEEGPLAGGDEGDEEDMMGDDEGEGEGDGGEEEEEYG